MTKEEIIRMAQTAGLYSGKPRTPATGRMIEKRLKHFAELVAAAVLAEPEPEPYPVAWMESPHGAIRANPLYRITLPSSLLTWSIPLYIHPPKARDWATDAIRARGESK